MHLSTMFTVSGYSVYTNVHPDCNSKYFTEKSTQTMHSYVNEYIYQLNPSYFY